MKCLIDPGMASKLMQGGFIKKNKAVQFEGFVTAIEKVAKK